MDNDIKAKVFISCGQRKKSNKKKFDEVSIAHEVASVLVSMGFDEPYIAVYDRSLRGLKENIFSHLETSEYFLLIDFCREKLDDSDDRRGSLFCNQELAIASYLELEAIGFQQRGVKERDGILGFIPLIQSHHKFDDPKELPEMVRREVKRAGWLPDWKNALRITSDANAFNDTTRRDSGEEARYFHLKVENLHKRKIALGCTAYIESIRDLQRNIPVPLPTVELKWEGYTLPNASIMPKSNRGLDAFFVFHQRPNELYFANFTDSTRFMQPLCGPGDYELTYVVISQNCPIVKATFTVHIENQLDRITFS